MRAAATIYFFYENSPESGQEIIISPKSGHQCPENRHNSPEINIEILQDNTDIKTILQQPVLPKGKEETRDKEGSWYRKRNVTGAVYVSVKLTLTVTQCTLLYKCDVNYIKRLSALTS